MCRGAGTGSPRANSFMLEPRLILVNLLIKLGVAAALSSALVRSKEFKSLLFREQREPGTRFIWRCGWRSRSRSASGFDSASRSFSRRRPVARNRAAAGRDRRALVGRRRRSVDGAARAVARRVGQHAAECVCRNYRRTIAPGRARTGRHLVVLALHRSHPLSHDSPQSAAAARVRLAGRFFCHHRGLRFLQTKSGASGRTPSSAWKALGCGEVGRRNPERVSGGERDLPDRGHGGGHGTENLQQRSHPDQAGRAGTAAAAGAHGGACRIRSTRIFCSTR
jgi:hypothetical protein